MDKSDTVKSSSKNNSASVCVFCGSSFGNDPAYREAAREIGVPVVSSTPHGLMNAVRLVGVSPRASGFGAVFAKA